MADTAARLRGAVGRGRRLVVKIGSSSLTSADGGRLDVEALTALVEVLAARRADGGQVVLVSSGAIAAGLGPLGLERRPSDLATQQAAASVGQGALVAAYQSGVLALRPHRRPGAAHRRRHGPPQPLHERPPHPRAAARARRRADRQRERHGGHPGDPLRRQRPARRPRRRPRRGRRPRPAHRRRRPVRRSADAAGVAAGAVRRDDRRPRRGDHRRHRLRGGQRRDGHQGRGGGHRRCGRGADPAHPAGRRHRGPLRRRRGHRLRPGRRDPGLPQALAGPRDDGPRTPRHRRRRRHGRHRAAHLPPRGRDHRGDRLVRGGRPGRRLHRATAGSSPGGSSASPPGSCRSCSGARPATWPASSGRPTSARSSTATTSSSSEPGGAG